MKREPIRKPIAHFLSCKIKMIPTYPDGRTRGSWKSPEAFTTDPERIKTYWREGFRRYQFHPSDNGLLCFDIDRKKGKDGLLACYSLFTDAGLALPEYLQDIESFPALTVTPSGGYHLYFKYQGTPYTSGDIAAGLECVHYNHLLTVPGSRKESGVYTFYGDLQKAPVLPAVFWRFLTERHGQEARIRPVWTYKYTDGELGLNDIAGIIDRQGRYSPSVSRNRYTYEIARFARKKGHSSGEVESYIRDRLEAPDFDAREISRTVQSAYRR